IYRCSEFSERPHGAFEVLDIDGRLRVELHFCNCRREAALCRLYQKRALRLARIAPLILLFLDGEDVVGPLDANEQVRSILGLKKTRQRFDALHDQGEIILARQREDRIDEVMSPALLAQIDLEAI